MAIRYVFMCELQTVKTRSNYFDRSVGDFMLFHGKCNIVDLLDRGLRSDHIIADFVL